MARRTIIRLENGEQRQAVELDFNVQDEQWNLYPLLDGGHVRLKTTAVKIFRILDADGNPDFTPEGEPLVRVTHVTYVAATD